MMKKAIIAKLKRTSFEPKQKAMGSFFVSQCPSAGATTQKLVYGQSRDVDRFDGHKGVYQD
jgi:hypothetical protein